jgi:Type III restriction enzyme, res subunit
MSVTVIKNSELIIPCKSVNLEKLKKGLTFPNPKYVTSLRFSKRVDYKIPKTLQFYELVKIKGEECIKVPRNSLRNINDVVSTSERVDYSSTNYEEKDKKVFDVYFNKLLREYQIDYINKYDLSHKKDLILCMPCGTGKTVVSLYLISTYCKQTVIFVPTNFLKKQWFERCNEFLLDAKVLAFDDKTNPNEVLTCDILIITFEMYNARELDLSKYGCSVFDEAHRLGAETYYPIAASLDTEYRIALSATFRRPDGLDGILHHVFGEQFVLPSHFPKCKTYYFNFGDFMADTYYVIKATEVNTPLLNSRKEFYKMGKYYVSYEIDFIETVINECTTSKQKTLWYKIHSALESSKFGANISALETIVADFGFYKKFLVAVIRKAVKSGRRPLVLSKRVELLKFLHNQFKSEFKCQIVLGKANKMSDDDIDPNTEVLFGIMQLAQEGLDADFLDTLILTHPIKDIEQAYGRIRRLKEGKKPPLVIQPRGLHFILDKIGSPMNKIFKQNSTPPIEIYSLKDLEL